MSNIHKVFAGYFSTEYPAQHIKNLIGYHCPKARNIVVFQKPINSNNKEVWFCCILFSTRKCANEAIENLSEIKIRGEGLVVREWFERRPAYERRNVRTSRFKERRTGERRTYSFKLVPMPF